MLVTVLADASHCPEYKVAGYGFWIASARGKKGGGRAMKNLVPNSTLAEMQAVVNAVFEGLREGLIREEDSLLLQTDCESAIFAFSSSRIVTQEEKIVVEALYNLLDRFKLKAEIRHVKGHSRRQEARYKANNHCDERAKKAMRKARNDLILKNAKEMLEASRKKGLCNETISESAETHPKRR